MDRHAYFGLENLALNDAQRGLLVTALRALGPSSHPSPACLCHWRVRPDGQAAIFEALFDEDTITIAAFKARLGGIFGVDPASIGHDTRLVTLANRQSAVVTFSRGGTDYLRVVFFGYAGADWPAWMASGDECHVYLRANAAEWEQFVA